MAGLAIHMSNRMELLAEQLATLLRQPAGAPLTPEIVVVQSRGMQRWLSLELARRNGVCANVEFPFPNAFLSAMLGRLSEQFQVTDEDQQAVTAFRLMRLLPEYRRDPDFSRHSGYLADDHRGLKRRQLCCRIAFLFDQYQVYRPEMLERWEDGVPDADPEARWQAKLWRRLRRESGPAPPVRWPRSLAAIADSRQAAAARLPERAAVFGVSYLPPLYLHLLRELSGFMRLHLFWLNPCREYWGDIVSERRALKMQRAAAGAELYLEGGNRLLAGLGALGRDFMRLLMDCEAEIFEHYEDPGGETLLAQVQSDILNLRDRQGRPEESLQPSSPPADDSIQVHSCHSPLRELEVLHDQLLAMLETDPGLTPDDIVVMTPDIERYAPFIQAVFGAQIDPERRIPYSIADRSQRSSNGAAEGLLALMDLPEHRFAADRVLRLLEYPGVMARFGMAPADLDRVTRWVREAQIRWGLDGDSRARQGLPAFEENTWRAGLRRLLLGWAMPAAETASFEGILPYDHVEGGESVVLGNLIEFVDRLAEASAVLSEPKPMERWRTVLLELVARFFDSGPENALEVQALRQAIEKIAQSAAEAGFEEPLQAVLVRALLQEQLSAGGGLRGFLGQGVTFCALLPMRSIPFTVVCLIGMDHAAFPRHSQPLSFDLMAGSPRPGDRSRRHDDNYLFLEAILSARRRLYISYSGQSIQDNSPVPPSVLVRELMEAVDAAAGAPVSEALTVRHRLQPFSGEYFGEDQRLFTYTTENLLVCEGVRQPQPPPPFFAAPLPLTPEETARFGRVAPEELAGFWEHPARFPLRRRLGLYLEGGEAAIEDSERFALDGLERYRVGEQLLQGRLQGKSTAEMWPLLSAAGRLPPANAGRAAFELVAAEVESMVGRLADVPLTLPLAPLEVTVDLRVGPLRLSGPIAGACRGGCLKVRFAAFKPRDLLALWVYHLTHALAVPGGGGPESYLVCREGVWRLVAPENAERLLAELVELFLSGIQQPIPFPPQSAFAFVSSLEQKGGDEAAARRAARRAWEGSEHAPGEGADPYTALCFREREPLGADFQKLALRVFGPLLRHLAPAPAARIGRGVR